MVPQRSYDDREIKVIIDAVHGLETNIRELHEQLVVALGDMDALRHKATASQHNLIQLKNNDEDSDMAIQELGRIMRGFQEQGRLFETVADPLKLTGLDIAAKLRKSANDLTNIINRHKKDPR